MMQNLVSSLSVSGRPVHRLREKLVIVYDYTKMHGQQNIKKFGKIVSIKISSDAHGNRTRDLPACSAVPQPTALREGVGVGWGGGGEI